MDVYFGNIYLVSSTYEMQKGMKIWHLLCSVQKSYIDETDTCTYLL